MTRRTMMVMTVTSVESPNICNKFCIHKTIKQQQTEDSFCDPNRFFISRFLCRSTLYGNDGNKYITYFLPFAFSRATQIYPYSSRNWNLFQKQRDWLLTHHVIVIPRRMRSSVGVKSCMMMVMTPYPGQAQTMRYTNINLANLSLTSTVVYMDVYMT